MTTPPGPGLPGPSAPGPRLLGPAEVRALAAELDVRPTKQRGQNFVIDPNTVRRIVRESGVGATDVVVEVGPGLGSLTLALLEVGAAVTAIEIDERLGARLPETIAEFAPDAVGRFRVVVADALRVAEVPGPPPTALVANLPYNVSVPVLLHLLALLPSLERGLVMVQSEVADRLAATPGSKTYGVPSVKAAWFADVRRAGAIGRNVFWPAPNVDSGLVAWTRREPPATHVSREAVFALVDAAFAQRRKTIRAALRGAGVASSEVLDEALAAAGIDPTARGEVLAIDDFVRLAEALDPTPIRLRPPVSSERGIGRRIGVDERSVTVRAAAKVNLHLGVGPVRDDGFHPLETVYQAIGLYDDLTATAAAEWSVSVKPVGPVDVSDVPLDDTNLAVRAGRFLLAHHGRDDAAHLDIAKGIPVAGGLAGGSADAAAALVAIDRLFALDTTEGDLLALAGRLGSDVPFALLGGTALGEGHGELVTRVDDHGAWWWVVLPSSAGLSTPAVYREYDAGHPGGTERPAALLAALESGDPEALGAALHNDLEGPAFVLRPDLPPIRARLRDSSAVGDLLSGSGPTFVALARDAVHARELAAELGAADFEVVLYAPGPVAGAHVIAESP